MGCPAGLQPAGWPGPGDPALAKKAVTTGRWQPLRDRPGAGPGAGHAGRYGARRLERSSRIDWPATLRLGRPRQRADLQFYARSQPVAELWLVLLDASASTRRSGALGLALGLLGQLGRQAYRQRQPLALLQASGPEPRWLWPGRRPDGRFWSLLEGLGAGGGTPLAAALREVQHWLRRRQCQQPGEQHRLLVLTDGRWQAREPLPPAPCPALLVDIECTPLRLGRARTLAAQLQADYWHIEQLPPCRGAGAMGDPD